AAASTRAAAALGFGVTLLAQLAEHDGFATLQLFASFVCVPTAVRAGPQQAGVARFGQGLIRIGVVIGTADQPQPGRRDRGPNQAALDLPKTSHELEEPSLTVSTGVAQA